MYSFQIWSSHANIDFMASGPFDPEVDIDISFLPAQHGDMDFDGKDGSLAHAFYPRNGGDIHLDEEEEWTTNSPEGKGLLGSLLMSCHHASLYFLSPININSRDNRHQIIILTNSFRFISFYKMVKTKITCFSSIPIVLHSIS